jgi:hypothetical protein
MNGNGPKVAKERSPFQGFLDEHPLSNSRAMLDQRPVNPRC